MSALPYIVIILAAVAFGLLCYWLTRPSCWVCQWCGDLYRKNGSTVQHGDEDAHSVALGMCPKCREYHDHSLPVTPGRSGGQLLPRQRATGKRNA